MRILLLSSLLFLSSCSSSNNNGSSNPPPNTALPEINAFSISPQAVDPSINGGNFSLSWSLSHDPSSAYVTLYLSTNDTHSSVDPVIFERFCTDIDCAKKDVNTDCTFTNSNMLSCPDMGNETDISDFLDEIPKQAFLIFEMCADPLGLDCELATTTIELR